MDGHPVPVLIQCEETGNFELDEEALEEVLLNPKIADKCVCVLAVAGAFRKGKSFLLDFLLRYMSSQVSCFYLMLIFWFVFSLNYNDTSLQAIHWGELIEFKITVCGCY